MNLQKLLTRILILVIIFPMSFWAQESLQPAASFLGTHPYERVGYHIHSAGDVNGDGCDDFLIGNFHTNKRGYNSGAVYLILGNNRDAWSMCQSLNSADARFLGGKAYDAVGYCVAGGGDINGDGYDDFLVGAPAGDESVIENPGHVYVVFGKATADWGQNCILPTTADAAYDGEKRHDLAGLSVAVLEDLNQDGYADFLCGAPYNDQGHIDAGKVYLLLGKATGWSRGINLSQADASFYGTSRNGLVGYAVDGLGDVNGDQIPDFIIGARGESKAYLFFGRKSVNWGSNLQVRQADVTFSGEEYNDWTGWRVSRAGDVNGDGFNDLLISAPLSNSNGADAGKIYLIFGREYGWKGDLHRADASFIGEAENDQAGWDVQDAGDVNGDGFDDFLIGAWYNDSNGENSGKVYLIKGKPNDWHRNTSLRQVKDYFIGEHAGDYAGFSVATAGDVNQDGLNDIIASATYNGEAYRWGGKILLFLSKGTTRLQLSITPTQLDFQFTQTRLDCEISNSGTGQLTWSAEPVNDTHWLVSIAPNFGKLNHLQSQKITVTVTRQNLLAGRYFSHFSIESNGGSEEIRVRMNVVFPPHYDSIKQAGAKILQDLDQNSQSWRVDLNENRPVEPNSNQFERNNFNQPVYFKLYQNFPNPFNPGTTITFNLPVEAYVKLSIFNIKGQQVTTLVNTTLPAGYQVINWPTSTAGGNPLPSGTYYYQIEATALNGKNPVKMIDTKKMLLKK